MDLASSHPSPNNRIHIAKTLQIERWPKAVVFGHTPQREARIALPFHIGLDTGLVYGNKLSCLDVEGRRLLQVRRGARRVVERDLDAELTTANL